MLQGQPPAKRSTGEPVNAAALPSVYKRTGMSSVTHMQHRPSNTIQTARALETVYLNVPKEDLPYILFENNENLLRKILTERIVMDENQKHTERKLTGAEKRLKEAEMKGKEAEKKDIADAQQMKSLQAKVEAAEQALAEERTKVKTLTLRCEKLDGQKTQAAKAALFDARQTAQRAQLASDRKVVEECLDFHGIPNEANPYRPSLHDITREVDLLSSKIDHQKQELADERETNKAAIEHKDQQLADEREIHKTAINKKDNEIKDVIEQKRIASELQTSQAELEASKKDHESALYKAIITDGVRGDKIEGLKQKYTLQSHQLEFSELQRKQAEHQRDEAEKERKEAEVRAADLAQQLEKASESAALLADREILLAHFKAKCSYLGYRLKGFGVDVAHDAAYNDDEISGDDKAANSLSTVGTNTLQNHGPFDRDSALGSSVKSNSSSFLPVLPATAHFGKPSYPSTSLGQPSLNHGPQPPQKTTPSHEYNDDMDDIDDNYPMPVHRTVQRSGGPKERRWSTAAHIHACGMSFVTGEVDMPEPWMLA